MRNALLQKISPGGEPERPRYTLDGDEFHDRDLGVAKDATTTRSEITLTVDYKLRDNQSGKVVLKGKEQESADYNMLTHSYYSNVVSQDSTREGIIEMMSDLIKLGLASHLSKQRMYEAYASQLRGLPSRGLGKAVSALFYGEEEPFVLEKVSFFINQVLKLESADVSVVEGAALLSKEVFLEDLLGTQSLWGEEVKALWVQKASDKVLSILQDYLEGATSSAMVIVTSDKYLKPASKMRKYYEQESNLLSMGCFAPTVHEVREKLGVILTKAEKAMDAGLLGYLSELFVSSPMLLESEMSKLLTYMGERPQIIQEDVAACIVIDELLDYDSLTHAFLMGNPTDTIRYFREQVKEGGSSIGVVRMILAQARRLYALHGLKTQGKTFEQAAMSVSPPVFSHQRPKFQTYLRGWSPAALQELMDILMQLEVESKKFSEIANISCERSLIRGIRARKRLKIS